MKGIEISYRLGIIVLLIIVVSIIGFYFSVGCSVLTGNSLSYTSPNLSPPQSASTGQIQFLFPRAGGNAEGLLCSCINTATSSIDIAIYSITLDSVKLALIKEKAEGTKIRILTDAQQSGGKYQEALLTQLKTLGIPVKKNKHSGLMHLKMTIVDNRLVTTGSYNYSKAASSINDEVFVVVTDPEVVQKSKKEFERLWLSSGFEDF